jgi:xylan 1,4-beta-xylosidase
MMAILSLVMFVFIAAAANYTISVNANQKVQQWNRFYEKLVATDHVYTALNSYWKRNMRSAMKVGNRDAGFQYFRGHGIFGDDVNLVDVNTDGTLKLTWTRFDSIYDAGYAANMRPIFEVGFTPSKLAAGTATIGLWYNGKAPNKTKPTKYGWNTWMALMDSVVKHVEQRYGVLEVRNNWYFEIWNECDWMYTGVFSDYLELYDYSVTGLLKADSLIKVGGPALSAPSSVNGIPNFLKHCFSATNPATGKVGTRVDFVTYHRYGTDAGFGSSVANANGLNDFHKSMYDTLKHYPAFKGLLINDEFGPNSGIQTARDLECTGSMVAKTIHLLNTNGTGYPPPDMYGFWALSDIYEENQNNTNRYTFAEATQGMFLRGDPADTNSWEIGKCSFQAYRMLHKLGAWEIKSSGGTKNDGVNAVATISSNNDSIQIMVYNHYNGGNTRSLSTGDSVTIMLDSIPFAPGPIRVEHWLVDSSHSNAYRPWKAMGSPAVPTAAQWLQLKQAAQFTHYDSVTTMSLPAKSWSKSFLQKNYSVGLIIITRNGPSKITQAPVSQQHAMFQTIQTKVVGKNLYAILQGTGQYTIRLFSVTGRKILDKVATAPGVHTYSLNEVPAGAYIVQCVNGLTTQVQTVIVGK